MESGSRRDAWIAASAAMTGKMSAGTPRSPRRREQIARAVTAAVAEERREWEAWNRRWVEAERRGEPFDEPPPSTRQHAAEVAKQ